MASELPPFSEVEDDWKVWVAKFEQFLVTKEVKRQLTPRQKLAFLRLKGGITVNQVLENTPAPPEEQASGRYVSIIQNDEYKQALALLNGQLEKILNPIAEEMKFRNLSQKPTEKAREFALRIRVQANRCEFPNTENEIARQFVHGTLDTDVKVKFFNGKLLTIQQLVDRQSNNEIVSDLKKRSLPGTSSSEINAIGSTSSFEGVRCYKCGGDGHYANRCPKSKGESKASSKSAAPYQRRNKSSNWTCFGCGGKGHKKADCKNKADTKVEKPEKVRNVKEEDAGKSESNDEYLFFLGGGDEVQCEVAGVNVYMLVDSGCTSNILNLNSWKLLKGNGAKVKNMSKEVKKSFKAYGSKDPLVAVGSFEAEIKANGKSVMAQFYVLDVQDRCLLGNVTAKALGVLQVNVSKR